MDLGKEGVSLFDWNGNSTSNDNQYDITEHTQRRLRRSNDDPTSDHQQHVAEHTRPRRLHPLNDDSTSDAQHRAAGNAHREKLLKNRHLHCCYSYNRPRRPLLLLERGSVQTRRCFIWCVALLLLLAGRPATCFKAETAICTAFMPAITLGLHYAEAAVPASSTEATSCRYSCLSLVAHSILATGKAGRMYR